MIGEKLLGKLWDTVAREGVGSLASPWQTRRQGKANVDARRDELLMLAQTEIDVADIKAGRKIFTEDRKLVSLEASDSETSALALRDGRIEPTFSLEELRDNTLNTRQARDIQEQINVTKAVLFAEEELENNYTEGSEEDLDSDWFARWRDSVEKISSEDLQRLWAKALAGELASPGSYSLRTLEFIKNISKSEAHESSGKKAEFEVYKVTKLGMEVLRLGVFPMNTDYLEQIGTKVKTQGFKVIIADWVQTTKTHGQYFNAREL
ncbi:TPA: DUF2806 domain-containing protein [Vibrio parahaemolyticus]